MVRWNDGMHARTGPEILSTTKHRRHSQRGRGRGLTVGIGNLLIYLPEEYVVLSARENFINE